MDLEFVRFAELERGAGAIDLPRGGVDHFLARAGHHQRFALLRLLESGIGGFPTVAVLVVLRGGNVVVLIKRLGAVPVALSSIHFRLGLRHGGVGFLDLLRARTVLQLGETGVGGREIGALLFQIGRLRLALPFQRGLRLLQLRFRQRQRGGLRIALGVELIAVQAGDDLTLGYGVALIHGALDQLAGSLEGNVDLLELDVAGDQDAVAGRAAAIGMPGVVTAGGQDQQYRRQFVFSSS